MIQLARKTFRRWLCVAKERGLDQGSFWGSLPDFDRYFYQMSGKILEHSDIDGRNSDTIKQDSGLDQAGATWSYSSQNLVIYSQNESCVDKDECKLNPDICGKNAECVNDVGAYHCVCAQGFEKTRNGDGCVGTIFSIHIRRLCDQSDWNTEIRLVVRTST